MVRCTTRRKTDTDLKGRNFFFNFFEWNINYPVFSSLSSVMNCELTTCLPRCRQKDRGIAESRALVAESWFLFVCSVVLPHLRSSRLIIVQPLPLNLLPPPPSFLHSFWFCVTASPHLRELSKSSVFVFRCLPRNVFLSSPAHKLICIQTHTYT